MPRVLNKHHGNPPQGSVYIGRPSLWGNPFTIGPDGDRDEVIRKYSDYMQAHPELRQAAKNHLRGKDLVCFCAPLPCHGDILILIANSKEKN